MFKRFIKIHPPSQCWLFTEPARCIARYVIFNLPHYSNVKYKEEKKSHRCGTGRSRADSNLDLVQSLQHSLAALWPKIKTKARENNCSASNCRADLRLDEILFPKVFVSISFSHPPRWFTISSVR